MPQSDWPGKCTETELQPKYESCYCLLGPTYMRSVIVLIFPLSFVIIFGTVVSYEDLYLMVVL